MELADRLLADLNQAMRAGDSSKVSTLRMIRSELKNAEIAHGGQLSENMALQTFRQEVKKRKEAAQAFAKAGKALRQAQEIAEAVILETYLPQPLDPRVIEEFAQNQISQLENPSIKDRGTVIKASMEHFGAQADGQTVSAIVSRLLP